MRLIFDILIVLLSCTVAAAESDKKNIPRIQLNAILNNAVVITIDGQQQMLTKNSLSKEGYKLTRIDNDKITLLISGDDIDIQLGAVVTSSKSAKSGKRLVNISRDERGMYLQSGKINGFPVSMLIDTGATFVAINSVLAKQIGIDYLGKGKSVLANTASGTVSAYKLVLDNVSLGELELLFVDAMVIEGDFPITPLLGMSFLNRVKITDDGTLLTIEEKF